MRLQELKKAFSKGKVSALLGRGISMREISRSLGIPRSTLRSWQANHFRLQAAQKSGRPRVTTESLDRKIRSCAVRNPQLSVRQIAAMCGSKFNTTMRRLKEAGFKSRRRRSEILLTARHKEKRLQWAMKHCHWRTPQWKRIVWTDEASVRLHSKDGRLRLWIRSTETASEQFVIPRIQGGGGWLLIWAAIWIDGKTDLHIQRATMNGERYVKLLEEKVYPLSFQLGDPSTQWFLMDDNAPPHRCRAATAFKTSAGIRTLTWPARSPDLNPIENLWSLLKLFIRRNVQPEDDLSRLEELLHRGWASISQEIINRTIESLPARIGKVIEKNGGNI